MEDRRAPKTILFRDESPFTIDYPTELELDGRLYDSVRHYAVCRKRQVLTPGVPELPQGLTTLELRALSIEAWVVAPSAQREAWDAVARDVMMRANLAKFADDLKLRAQLLLTEDAVLGFADPDDLRWGIGLAADDPRARDPRGWPGANWLGNVLTALRQHLMVINSGGASRRGHPQPGIEVRAG